MLFLTHKYLRFNREMLPVCKGCRMRTLVVSNKFKTTVTLRTQASYSGIIQNDNRGKHPPENKFPDTVIAM